MLKALFKKQFLELNTFYFMDRKTGKLRPKGKIIGTVSLYAALMLLLAGVFFIFAGNFAPLLDSDIPWLYYSITGITAILMGVFGSVFNTYAGMFHAKDDELLLSMPIPPAQILLVRIFGVALMSLMYESIVIVPVIIKRFIAAPISVSGVICSLLLIPVIGIIVIVLTCFLGWLVALVSSRFKSKSFLTVLAALVFFGAYYYFFSQSYSFIEALLLNSAAVGAGIKKWAYPFYLMGMAGEGDVLSMLLFTLIALALFGLTWFILSKTFIGISTKNRGEKKKAYKESSVRVSGMGRALFRREMKKFTSSANYMLNCALGTVFMLVAAVALVIYSGKVQTVLFGMMEGYEQYLPLLPLLAVMLCCAMNDITAPAISLEGKNLWIVRSLPAPTKAVLLAKRQVHWVVTLPMAVALILVSAWVFKLSLVSTLLCLVLTVLFVLFTAALGLVLNLQNPNLTWTNEIIPIKQGTAPMIMILGGWVVIALFAFGLYLLRNVLSVSAYLGCVCVLLAVLTVLLRRWIDTKGVRMFEEL